MSDSVAVKQASISRALRARGADVVWVGIEGHELVSPSADIPAHKIETRVSGRAGMAVGLLKLLWYCISTRVDCVFWDDWSFWRYSGQRRVALQFCLKLLRIRHVQDERDPLTNFVLAEGAEKRESSKFIKFRRYEAMSHGLADLILLPSAAYADTFVREGVKREKVFGVFRGIDSELFNSGVDGSGLRARLNLTDKFVICFISHFNRFRLIEEVVVPLVETAPNWMPNAFFLIGGFGDLESEIRDVCNRHPRSTLLMEYVPYPQVPEYLAASDLTISPLQTNFEHSLNAISLKVVESLMVGRPAVATWTRSSDKDLEGLKGVIWVGTDIKGFQDAITKMASDPSYARLAADQATHMEAFTTESAVNAIVQRILRI